MQKQRSSRLTDDERPRPQFVSSDLPPQLRSCPYSNELKVAIELAVKCGNNMFGYCNDKGTAAEEGHDLGINTKS